MTVLDQIDLKIRAGHVPEARALLLALLRRKSAKRADRTKLANCLWRVGLPARGLRVLSPSLAKDGNERWAEFPDETAEYAVCLAKLGAFEESKRLLQLPEVASVRQAALYLGFCYLETWDYERAIPHLTQYVKNESLSSYHRLVGLANLAAALVYEREHVKARPILRRLLHDAHLGEYVFLLGFALETAAADQILSGRFSDAEKFLADAERRWSTVDGFDKFFLEKWRAILSLRRDGKKDELSAVREKALSIGHWETARDCDRHLAIVDKDAHKVLEVYFGTPYPALRRKLLAEFGLVNIPEHFAIRIGKGKGEPLPVRTLIERDISLSAQSRALFSLLASESYRPQRLATLFGWLFPDERFNAVSTPKRMHEAIRRLEKWLKAKRIPLFVEEIGSVYRLQASRPVDLWVSRPGDGGESWRPLLYKLHRGWGTAPFAVRDVEKTLSLPRRTVIRRLQSLVASGHLRRIGTGSRTRYQLLDKIQPYLKEVG